MLRNFAVLVLAGLSFYTHYSENATAQALRLEGAASNAVDHGMDWINGEATAQEDVAGAPHMLSQVET